MMQAEVVPGALARGVAVSTSAQLAAKLVHFAVNVVSSLAIIRYLGPTTFGSYVLIVAVIALFGLLSDLGLDKVAIREIVRVPTDERPVLATVICMRLLLASAAIVGVQLFLVAMGASSEIRAAAAVLSMILAIEAVLTVVVAFHVRLRQHHEAFVRVIGEIVETTLVLVVILRHGTFVQIVTTPVVGGLVAAMLAVAIAARTGALSWRPDPSRVRPLLLATLPVGGALILATLQLQVGRLVLAAEGSPHDVGIYGAAYQAVEYLLLASAVLINVLYPVVVRFHESELQRFLHVYRSAAEALIALVLPLPIVLALLGSRLVPTIFGQDFADAAAPLAILSCGLVFMVVTVWQGFVLLSAGRQRVTLAYQTLALAISTIAALALIPSFGPVGAAIATSGTAVVVTAISTYATARYARVTLDAERLIRIAGANALLAAALVVVLGVSGSTLLAAAAVALYPGALLATGGVRRGAVRRAVRVVIGRPDEMAVAR